LVDPLNDRLHEELGDEERKAFVEDLFKHAKQELLKKSE